MGDSVFEKMAERWPSGVVARCEISKFTGGAISEKYAANLDCAGKGPKGRIRIGRKVCYPTIELARWLAARSEPIPDRPKADE
jgi:hypothetical protein